MITVPKFMTLFLSATIFKHQNGIVEIYQELTEKFDQELVCFLASLNNQSYQLTVLFNSAYFRVHLWFQSFFLLV